MTAVTVLMPVHNGARFVRETIESILRQSWTDFELLIIDDGSTDGTRDVIGVFRDPRIRVLTNPLRLGLSQSLNRGLSSAKGTLVARHDADDRSHPARLATQTAFLRSNPAVALVGAQVRVLDERGRVSHPPGWRKPLTEVGIRFHSMFDNPFIHSSVMFRRDPVWSVLGGYDTSLVSAEDFDLWSRVAARYRVRNLPQTLVDFRVHEGSFAAQFGGDHIARSSAVVARNLRSALRLDEVPDEWCRMIASLHVSPHARGDLDGRDLIAVLSMIVDRYVELHPEAKRDRDIRRVVATKFAAVACWLACVRRPVAFHAFARACGADVCTAVSFGGRFVALFLGGDHLRRLRRAFLERRATPP
jgi:glycosyl transferase family 2